MAGVRRTWDKAAYEIKAKERLENEGSTDVPTREVKRKRPEETKEEFRKADRDAQGPMGSERAFISARQDRIDIDSKVGKTEIISPTEIQNGGGAGYFCEICACLLKDSTSYLDHINGKKHQRALGFSMRVERADISKVKDRLAMLKEKIEEKKRKPAISSIDSYEARLAAQLAEEELKRRARREEKERLKAMESALTAEGESDVEQVDPVLEAIMGFGGFGGSKK